MARELDLTNNQYRMLLHQCDALARAGAQNFLTPAIGRRTSWKPTSITAISILRRGRRPADAER